MELTKKEKLALLKKYLKEEIYYKAILETLGLEETLKYIDKNLNTLLKLK